MGLLDELEQIDKSKSKNEIVLLLRKIEKNQLRILKKLDKLTLAMSNQSSKKK
jgi:hypothetical protein